jgi:hypothetical protein
MKLLIWYCSSFGYTPSLASLEDADPDPGTVEIRDAVVGFIQAEEADQLETSEVEKKVLKNLKWAAGKNETKRVVLHSFAHLSDSKASPAFTRELFHRLQDRLESAGYEVFQTPFGWFLDLRMDAPGKSLARVFKSF